MPCEPKAWFNKQTRWWSTDIAGKRHKLVPGKPGDVRRKTPTQEATEALSGLLAECALNPTVESGPAVQTLPSIIDEYLDSGCRENEPRIFAENKALLGRFARRHRDKRVVDLIPLDLEKWLGENPGWKSDDYRAKVCTTVHACSNWAAARGLLGRTGRNPLAGFTVTGGNRRRSMTGPEFCRIWGQSRQGKKKGIARPHLVEDRRDRRGRPTYSCTRSIVPGRQDGAGRLDEVVPAGGGPLDVPQALELLNGMRRQK
jgi:hypothetical protein